MRIRKIIGIGLFFSVATLTTFPQQEIPKDLQITLTRYPCFGWCPHYSLTITSDGVVEFMPLGNGVYRRQGKPPSLPLKGSITERQLKELLAEFRKMRFSSLRREYGSIEKSKEGPTCPHYWTDGPSTEIFLKSNGKQKKVSHYLGCKGAQILEDLEVFEDKIDEIANSKQWTSQFGWNTANVTDLKLQVIPASPPLPKKPE